MACLGLDVFWTLAHISTQESRSSCLGLSPEWRLPTLMGGFSHELWTQSEGQLSTTRYAARLLDLMSQIHRTREACLSQPLSAHWPLVICSLCHVLRQGVRRLVLETSLESLKLSPSIIFTFEPLSLKERWRLRWKDIKLPGSYSVPSNFFKFLKNLHNSKFNSSSGMSDSSLFLLSCKQNRFYAFMSLCVLTFVFAGFFAKQIHETRQHFCFLCFHFCWHIRIPRFPMPSIQRPQEIFNCHGKDFSADKFRNRILMSRLQGNFSCGTKRVILSGQDHSTGFGSSCLLTELPT